MKGLFLLPFACCATAIIWLIVKLPDPFGAGFWSAVYFFLISGTASGFQLTYHLLRKKSWLLKISALLPFVFTLAMTTIGSSLAIDYRLLVPGARIRKTADDWKSDYEFLKAALRKHPAFGDSLKQSFFDKDTIPPHTSSDDEMLVSLMRLAGKLPDGHTFVHPLQPALKARYFPLLGYWFDDGYYIVRASKHYNHLLGQRLLAINGVDIHDVLSQVNLLTGPENPWNGKNQFDLFVFSANVLHGLGITESVDHVNLKTLDKDKAENISVLESEPFFTWFFWALKPVDAMELSPAYFNLRKPNYLLSYDSLHQSVLLPIHAMQNQAGHSFRKLSKELDTMITMKHPKMIVIDLRNSLGGDNTVYNELVELLQKREKSIKLFVLVSRKTFSASVNFISELKAATEITLVGEPTGAGPNHYGDAQHLLLPETGVSIFISTKKWVFDSLDNRHCYLPDIPIRFEHSDFINRRDPWLNAVYSDHH